MAPKKLSTIRRRRFQKHFEIAQSFDDDIKALQDSQNGGLGALGACTQQPVVHEHQAEMYKFHFYTSAESFWRPFHGENISRYERQMTCIRQSLTHRKIAEYSSRRMLNACSREDKKCDNQFINESITGETTLYSAPRAQLAYPIDRREDGRVRSMHHRRAFGIARLVATVLHVFHYKNLKTEIIFVRADGSLTSDHALTVTFHESNDTRTCR